MCMYYLCFQYPSRCHHLPSLSLLLSRLPPVTSCLSCSLTPPACSFPFPTFPVPLEGRRPIHTPCYSFSVAQDSSCLSYQIKESDMSTEAMSSLPFLPDSTPHNPLVARVASVGRRERQTDAVVAAGMRAYLEFALQFFSSFCPFLLPVRGERRKGGGKGRVTGRERKRRSKNRNK